ncbi:hypothetical protein LUZ60_007183 [Juncus effusus]|nr:hypothetical protein LUZ60_007183 [Juncus effusus]
MALPPLLLHLLTTFPIFLLSHFLHLPSFLLHALCSYLHPDSAPSATPRALLNPNQNSSKKHRPTTTPFDASAAQLYRVRLTHAHLATRLHFLSFHLSLLLPLSLCFPSFLLHYFLRSSNTLFPFISICISLTFLVLTLLRLSVEKSASNRPEKLFALISLVLAPLIAFLITPLTPLNSSALLSTTIVAIITPLLLIPSFQFASGFWLGTNQLHFDLPILSCSWIGFLLLYNTILVSFVSPLLFITPLLPPFMLKSVEPYRVLLLASGALLQILSLRAMVQMYLNEGVVCWYQQLHGSRVADLGYARAKIFLHNHRFVMVATQLVAPPAVVLLLLAIYAIKGDLFESFDFVKEMALFAAWWIMFAWSVVTMLVLACYRFGILLVN